MRKEQGVVEQGGKAQEYGAGVLAGEGSGYRTKERPQKLQAKEADE